MTHDDEMHHRESLRYLFACRKKSERLERHALISWPWVLRGVLMFYQRNRVGQWRLVNVVREPKLNAQDTRVRLQPSCTPWQDWKPNTPRGKREYLPQP